MPDETPLIKRIPPKRILSPPLNLHPPDAPPSLYESALQYFTSIPWCAELLLSESSPHGNGPAIPFIPQCLMPSRDEDQFVGATLATPRALKHMLCFFRPQDATQLRDPKRPVQTVDTLFDLGDALTGYRNIIHGGMTMTMTMVDEAMSTVNEINAALGKDHLVYRLNSVTAGLEVKFPEAGAGAGRGARHVVDGEH